MNYGSPRHLKRLSLATHVAFLLGTVWCSFALAGPRTFGWLEWGYLGSEGIRVKTKLDTGAKTSSIHAEMIVPFEKDGADWVRFTIPLEKRTDDSDYGRDLVLERPVIRETIIKERHGENNARYVVELAICIGGSSFTTPVTLADRSAFNYPLLLGRASLIGLAIVDPATMFTFKRGCTKRRKAD